MGARERKGIETARMKKIPRMDGLLQSGIIISAASFLVGLGGFAFQAIIGRLLKEHGEYGLVNSALAIVGLFGLPLAVATTAVTHYIARFNFSGDDARLRGLFAGCRKFLLRLTIAGSVLAIVLIKPLSDFFHFPRASVMLVVLACVLSVLWSGFATALCQGMGWFKRFALIAILGVCLRLTFGWLVVTKFPIAEWAVLASGVAALANLILLFWRKDFPQAAQIVSPWDREFVQFLVVAAACIGGSFCFTQGDLLVAQRYFSGTERDAYASAGVFARALPMTVAPMLAVLFTHRSGAHSSALREQWKLLGLYAIVLACGAVGLVVLRTFCLKIIGRDTPEAAAMIFPLALTMVFGGLLQALALWSLASRWMKISLLYGALGLFYWLTLLAFGKNPAALLRVMPAAAGMAFGVLFFTWLVTMRQHKPDVQS
jgi:O-antigen/teichoic acid export membrane protein